MINNEKILLNSKDAVDASFEWQENTQFLRQHNTLYFFLNCETCYKVADIARTRLLHEQFQVEGRQNGFKTKHCETKGVLHVAILKTMAACNRCEK